MAIKYGLIAAIIVLSVVLGRRLVADFRHGIVNSHLGTYSRAQHGKRFWLLSLLYSTLLIMVLAAVSAAIIKRT
jgi:hypothetical protein